ncbi:DUF2946 family protein [Cohaesibacter gelatinilyticus]|uniref:DUF2946 domain-containing protein n=1 Tax=Cohaesibacter gelatinilyticus TaxID=372072 RepID=A0A285NH82_9HYPH|nr:hypothetical protein [Cohaesibacter gelatinilyticus]SNZ07236.1 hypothetical protein SAMN06265368_0753 [Cohaesibacter gelatinilyticus]HAT85620.1 hypothetical protein [Hyphomicrobiales bacterium]
MVDVVIRLSQLARSYIAAWFAMLAISLQIVFGMAHTAAMLAVAAGPLILNSPDSLSYSYLQICTANGLISFEGGSLPEGSSERDQEKAKDRCPVCTSAATSPFTADAGIPICPIPDLDRAIAIPDLHQLFALHDEWHEPIRGPPVFS